MGADGALNEDMRLLIEKKEELKHDTYSTSASRFLKQHFYYHKDDLSPH